jgi:hypothetical protein
MPDSTENLIRSLLEWLARQDRTYEETMSAWRTSCPRLPVWEEANDRGFVEAVSADGRTLVRLTQAGISFLNRETFVV